jgi:hypothetical protein
LLPRPFAELTLDHVSAIIEAVGDEKETLWFERKAAISSNSLAKACAAFANTYGGLLVVGVPDDRNELVGISTFAGEAQLWVKDNLRAHILPMPPFRARWLPIDKEKGILLVLVEESTTTPHLLTRSGAIYVRSPGSSDPVPISDQRRLLDLTERGSAASTHAEERAREAGKMYVHDELTITTFAVALSATGIASDFEQRLFAPETPEYLSVTTWGPIANPSAQREWRRPVWRQTDVGVARNIEGMFASQDGVDLEGVVVERSGTALIYRGTNRPVDAEPRYSSMSELTLRRWFEQSLRAGRDLLLEYGAHGDLRLAYLLWGGKGRGINFDAQGGDYGRIDKPCRIELWTDFEEDVSDRVFAEVARALGIGPRVA